MNKTLVIGGTGAMGAPIVRRLLATTAGFVRLFTRDPQNARVKELQDIGGGRVEAVRGHLDDEASLVAAMNGVDAVFCNTDFWSSASPLREYEQGLRALRAAESRRLDHFVWSSLDNAVGLTGGRVPVPHFDSKAAVEGWIDLMRSEEFMKQNADGWYSRHVTVLVTAPYYENFQFRVLPKAGQLSDGRQGFVFNVALGGGRYPLIGLDDIAWFACHLLASPNIWAGRTLSVLGDSLSGPHLAKTFELVTGIPAEYRDVPLANIRAGMPETGHDIAGMFQFFQDYDVEARARDMKMLRGLHPGLMTFSDWLKKTNWRGEPIAVQKMAVQLAT